MLKSLIPMSAALLFAACATPKPIALPPSQKAVTITGKEQRALVALKPGGTVTVSLQANGSSGYHWRLGAALDSKVLALASAPSNLPPIALPPDNVMPSKPTTTEQWVFKAVGPGTTKVRMFYTRANEPLDEVSPYEFTVIAE